jgi:hypothetical protein
MVGISTARGIRLAILGFIRRGVGLQIGMEIGVEPAGHRHGFDRIRGTRLFMGVSSSGGGAA